MAKTSSQCRRRMQSSAGFITDESRFGSDSMRASPAEDSSHRELSIKQAIQRQRGKKVQAYVVMALYDDGDISTHTTDQISRCKNAIFTSDVEERLRVAHEESMLQALTGEDYLDRDSIYRPNFGDTFSHQVLLDDKNDHTAKPQPTESLYDLSRPISALSCGASNGWQSDFDDAGPAYSATFTRSHSCDSSIDHFQSLTISESDKVERFLIDRFQTMQQLAVKRIAKAWIKGICPKKQAFFPYHKKKREREGLGHAAGCIPGWWPETNVCRFVEPDHIKRDERISLCLHLLRLRPTPAKLKKWNKDCVEPHQTHVMKGWTEFLKELAPPSIFDDMREPEGKEQQERQRLLSQVYDLTQREEDYVNGNIDGEDVYYWPADDAEDKTATRKKNRRSWDSLTDDSGTDSYADSAPPFKRSKKNSSVTTPAGSPVTFQRRRISLDDRMQDSKPLSNAGLISDPRSTRSAAVSPQGHWDHFAPVDGTNNLRLIPPMHDYPQSVQDVSSMPHMYTHGSPWVDLTSPTPFTEPERQAITQAFAMDMSVPTLPGRMPQIPHQNLEQAQSQVCPAYMACGLPQPRLEDVSVTGLYTPPIPSQAPPASHQNNPYLDGLYYCQPHGAQPFATPIRSPRPNMPPSHNSSFRPCTTGPEQHYTVDPAIYRHHPESNQPSDQYPNLRHGGPDFQAPARVERGFTGHGSGVGGGAHT